MMTEVKYNRKLIAGIFSGVVILALILLYASNPAIQKSVEPEQKVISYPNERTIRYSFTVRNKTNQYMKGAEFWTYAPVKQTSFQQASTIETSHDYTLKVDEFGNQKVSFNLDLAPFATKIVSITAQLELSEKSNAMNLPNPDEFTGRQKYIEIDDEKIIALARQIGGNKHRAFLKNSFDWVAENIVYAGYIEDDRGALYALDNKRGDCTEYMYLFAALARLKNIPTRAIGGYVITEDAILKAREFHNWAEVYIDGSWRIVDPQNKKFMQQENRYIAMRVITEQAHKTNKSLSSTQRFTHADEGLEVRMN